MPSRSTLYRQAGLVPLGGTSRRWRDLRTGETISYNKGRARIGAVSARQRSKTTQFERALTQTKDVERARRESGLSKRGLSQYRQSFAKADREGASPWAKDKRGRWRFEAERITRTHTFVSEQGVVTHATFSGRELIAMQDYRSAYESNSQAALDAWAKAHPGGVMGANDQTYFPETNLKAIKARLRRMKPSDRKRYENARRYKNKEQEREAA